MSPNKNSDFTAADLVELRTQTDALKLITEKLRVTEMGPADHITVPTAVDTGPDVIRAADGLLRRIDPTPGVRLLGIHVSQLSEQSARQLSLDIPHVTGS